MNQPQTAPLPQLDPFQAAERLLTAWRARQAIPNAEEARQLLAAADRAALLRGRTPGSLPREVTAGSVAEALSVLPDDQRPTAALDLAELASDLLPLPCWGPQLWDDYLPAAIRSARVADTAISPKAASLAAGLGVATWGELLHRDLSLGKLPKSSGKAAIAAIWDSLANLLERERSRSEITRLDLSTHLTTTVANLVASTNAQVARDALVLQQRLGVNGSRPCTLAHIGRQQNLTRERVRQLEAKLWKELRRDHAWVEEARQRIAAAWSAAGGAIFLADLASQDPWLKAFCDHPDLVDACLGGLDLEPAYIKPVRSGHLLLRLTRKDLDALERKMSQRCRELLGAVDAATFLEPLLGTPEAKGLSLAALTLILRESTTLVDEETDAIPPPVGRGLANCARKMLEASPTPLHWSVIAKRLRELGQMPATCQDDQWVHVALSHDPGALRLGPGTYGIEAHLALTAEVRLAIADAATDAISAAGRDRQWSQDAIMALLPRHLVTEHRLDGYRLAVVLRLAGDDLIDLGRGFFMLTPDDDERPQRRHLRQAALTVLRSAGKPLSIETIAAAIDRERSCPTSSLTAILVPPIFRRTADGLCTTA